MDFSAEIEAARSDPYQLEQLYRAAQQTNQSDQFHSTLLALYETAPTDLLLAAWYYRLQQQTDTQGKRRRSVNWLAAVPLSLLVGLIFWLLSDFERFMFLDAIPYFILWWSSIATCGALAFIAVTSKKNYVQTVVIGAVLLALPLIVVILTPLYDTTWMRNQFLTLAALHLPLLSWVALGIATVGLRATKEARFAFLIKSIEVAITAGLFLIAGVAFGGITVGMFAALGIDLPEIWLRLIALGGLGLLPVMAVATTYDPTVAATEQNFNQGLSQFIGTMMRLLLPLTLFVLTIYLFVIPFNFLEPFRNRDVLIVYNLMLFGILGLLLGATPVQKEALSPALQKWLRSGILLAAVLVTLISVYALAAVIYRTTQGSLTLNRLMIIGWNSINISILGGLIYKQIKNGQEKWIAAMQSAFTMATNSYPVWGLLLLIVVPILFLITE